MKIEIEDNHILEKQVDEIVEKRWAGMSRSTEQEKQTLKLAILDGYGLGLEVAKKINNATR